MAGEEEESFPPEIQRLPTEFAFRELANLKAIVSESQPEYPTIRTDLLAVANIYGYVFIGMPDGLKVFSNADLLDAGRKNSGTIHSPIATIDLRNPPNWIGINSDNLTLSVCCKTDKGPQILFFDVRNILNKSKSTKTPFHSIFLNKDPESYVNSMQWNPSAEWPNLLAVCLSSGSFHLLSIENKATEIAIRPDNFGAATVCWSPKGKQMIVGKKDGTLHQFTQKLEVKRSITVNNVIDRPVRACDILWLSTHQVASAYVATDDEEAQTNLFLADIPSKNEQRDIIWKNYEDPCFGINESRDPRYLLEFIDAWEMFVTLSSNSTDTAVIAKNKESHIWEIWTLDDSSRATLPFSEYTDDDQAPIGSAIITTATERIVVDDVRECGPMPVLLILTNEGLLCMYHMINLMSDYQSLVSTPLTLDVAGERTSAGSKVPSAGEGDTSKPSSSVTKQKLTAKPSISSMSTPKPAGNLFESQLPTPTTSTTMKKSLFSASTPAVGKLPPFTEGPSIIQGSATKPPTKPPLMRETLLKASPFAPAKHTALDETADTVFGSNRSGSNESVFTNKDLAVKPQPKPSIVKPVMPQPTFTQQPSSKPSLSTASSAPTVVPNPTSVAAQPKINETLNFGLRQNKTPLMKTKSILPGASVPGFPPTKVLPTKTEPARTILEQLPTKTDPPARIKKSSSFKETDSDLKITLDDVTSFDEELREFQSTIQSVEDVQAIIGENDEKVKLQREIEGVSSFSKEISQTSQELSNEIEESTTSLLSLISEAKDVERKQNQATVGAYRALLYSRPLDRTQRQQLEAIRGLYQYVVTCVREANIALDAQWEEANKRKRALMGSRDGEKGKLQGGEWEAAYQGLVNNMKILHNQEMKIMLISQQLDRLRLEKTSTRSMSRSRDTATSSAHKSSTDLQMLADSLLLHREPATSSTENANDGSPKTSTKPSSQHKMSPKKQAQLGQMLANRRVTPVRSSGKLPSSVLKPFSKKSQNKEKLQVGTRSATLSDGPSSPQVQVESPVESESTPPGSEDKTPDSTSSSAPSSSRGFIYGNNTNFIDPGKGDVGFLQRKPEVFAPMPTSTLSSMIPQGAATLAYGAPKTVTPDTKRRDISNFATSGNAEAASNLNNPPQVVNIQKLQDQAFTQPKLPDKFQPKPEVPAGAAEVVQTVLNTVKAEKEQKSKGWNFESDKAPPSFLTSAASTSKQPEKPFGAFAIGKSASDGGKLFGSGFNLTSAAATGSVPSLLTGHSSLGPKTSSPASFGAAAPSSSDIAIESKSEETTVLQKNLLSANGNATSSKGLFSNVNQQTPLRSSSATAIFSGGSKENSNFGFKESSGVAAASVQSNLFGNQKKTTTPVLGLFKTPSSSAPFGANLASANENDIPAESRSSPDSPGLSFSIDAARIATTSTAVPSSQGTTLPSYSSSITTPGVTPPISASMPTLTSAHTKSEATASAVKSSIPTSSTDDQVGSSEQTTATATIIHARSSSSPHQATANSKLQVGIFGGVSKAGFGSTGNVFGASMPSSTEGLLGANTSTASTSVPSTTPSTTSLFGAGGGDNISTSAQSVFGSATAATASVFRNWGTSTSAPFSLSGFGNVTATSERKEVSTAVTTTVPASNQDSVATTASSVFGSATSAPSAFGSATTTVPAFGSATTTVPAFGSATTTAPAFGSATTTAPAFGSSTASTFGSTAFGAATTSPAFGSATTSSVFGSSTSAFGATTAPPAFGTTTTSVPAFGSSTAPSVFGSTPSAFGTSTAPAFGSTTTPSVFGSAATSSVFGSTPAFGATTAPSVFGSISTPSAFGTTTSSANVFGSLRSTTPTPSVESSFGTQSTASSSGPFGLSAFGASTQNNSVFGASAFGQKKTTAFGQTPFGGGFANTQATTASQPGPFSGGGFFSGLGGQASADAANKNPFQIGGEQGDNSSSSLFGNSGAKSFQAFGQNQQQQSSFGFSSPSGGVGSQGFGGFNKPQQSGFGAAPAFGASAAFGSPPSFGSSSAGGTFGGGFGSQSAAPSGGTFGQSSGGGFASFASNDAPGFGNLASQTAGGFGSPQQQQQQPSAFGGFGANTQKSPAFSGWR